MEEEAKERIRLQREQMEEELKRNMAIYNEKVRQMEIEFGLQKGKAKPSKAKPSKDQKRKVAAIHPSQ
uniref:Uncharacterized protein n=1 Tax=Romanomermis culicivorax TaxID=13658 RepID=A0A915HWQ0_ROMCU